MKNTFKRFNISDIVIMIGVIALVCGLMFRNPVERILKNMFYQSNIEYVVGVSVEDANYLKEGTEIKNIFGDSLGTVKFIKPDTAAKDENGIIVGYKATIETVGITDKLGTYIGDSMFIAPRLAIEVYTESNEPIICVVKKIETKR